MPILKDQEIVCISTSDWEYPFGSRQQIMQRLSRNNKVLFVESQVSFLYIFKYFLLFLDKLKKSFKGVQTIQEGQGNLYIYSPPPIFFPFDNYFMLINSINQAILLFYLKKVLKRLQLSPSILWIFHPRNSILLGLFSEKISIYHCIDEYSIEKENRMRKRVLANLERSAMKKADIVFTCTEALYMAKKHLHKNIHLLRGGVDIKSFKIALLNGSKIPPDIERIKPPRIGFSGTIDGRIDINLIFNIASQRPEWSIVLLGANRLNHKADKFLKGLKNIHFLGVKRHKEIPYYLMAMDICIIPYLLNEFTRFIFPLKFLEYLAAGKPVISTPLPELEFFKDDILIATDNKEFIKHIEYLLINGDNSYLERLNIAESNSWEIRVEEASHIICRAIENKRNVKAET